MKALALAAAAAAGLTWGSGAALAQQCPGVELRVMQATSQLGQDVAAHMTVGTADLIARYNLKVEALLSAMRVAVAQSSTSASQVNAAVVQSSEAAASAYVAGRLRTLTAEAADEYGSVGYDACNVGTRMAAYYAARQSTAASLAAPPSGPAAAPGLLADPGPWYSQIAAGGPYGAGALLGGDPVAATRYISQVMGPPDTWQRQDNAAAAAGAYLGGKLVRDARRGVAQHVLQSIAAANAPTGPRRALQAVVDTYTGDGGERWAASMAGSHERGILLDAVRLEAAALTAEVEDVRGQTLTELAAASHALARADTLVRDAGPNRFVAPLLVQDNR